MIETITTILGPLKIHHEDGKLLSLTPSRAKISLSLSPLATKTQTQLNEYLEGRRKKFNLPINLKGSNFKLAVLNELTNTSYGESISYGDIAKAIKKPGSARAVGGALNKNPLPLIIPCHRVNAANGHLTGFAWGLKVKRRLLELERQLS